MKVVRSCCHRGLLAQHPCYNDKLIASGLSPEEAQARVDKLNHITADDGPFFYKVCREDYQLKRFEP